MGISCKPGGKDRQGQILFLPNGQIFQDPAGQPDSVFKGIPSARFPGPVPFPEKYPAAGFRFRIFFQNSREPAAGQLVFRLCQLLSEESLPCFLFFTALTGTCLGQRTEPGFQDSFRFHPGKTAFRQGLGKKPGGNGRLLPALEVLLEETFQAFPFFPVPEIHLDRTFEAAIGAYFLQNPWRSRPNTGFSRKYARQSSNWFMMLHSPWLP